MSLRRPLAVTEQTAKRETPYTPVPAISEPDSSVEGKSRKTSVTPRAFADRAPSGLTERQVAEYQHRLSRGYYSLPAVVREVARRIIDSGDL
ncbi:MAG: hypothetical protein ACT4P7_23760 [Gemmatimonadaceae bacterium]